MKGFSRFKCKTFGSELWCHECRKLFYFNQSKYLAYYLASVLLILSLIQILNPIIAYAFMGLVMVLLIYATCIEIYIKKLSEKIDITSFLE